MNFNQTNNNQGDVINNGSDSVIEEWQKGAMLARAAPKLYAALERLLCSLDDIKFDDEFYAAMQAGKNALANARGEENEQG